MHRKRLDKYGTLEKRERPWQTSEERFWPKVDRRGPDECWPWLGQVSKGRAAGYGYFRWDGQSRPAYRFAYELLIGPIPEGMVLDHLCREPGCVNPAHLEAVSNRENVLRGVGPVAENAAKTHCVNGHEFDLANTGYRVNKGSNYASRVCRACARERMRERAKRKQAAA